VKRNTVQRQIILKAVRKKSTHPTVEEISGEVNKDHPTISKVTVYRNLRKLAGNGDIRQVLIPGEQERYDRRCDHHYHFKCKNCGTLIDIDIDYRGDMDAAVREKYDMLIDEHDIVFSGVCSKCRGDLR